MEHEPNCNLVTKKGISCLVYHPNGKCDWDECTCGKSTSPSQQVTSIFEAKRIDDVKKLTSVGFTEIQAETLLEMMQTKAFSGGLF